MAITRLIYPDPKPQDWDSTNLIIHAAFRNVFHFVAIVILVVPASILWRNRELAATVFTTNTILMNLYLFLSFMIWHSDNYENYWLAEGYCDVMSYWFGGLVVECIEATSIIAIMRHLAITVGDLRSSPLTVREKRNRNIVQILIIFPYCIVVIVCQWLTNETRYLILPLVGCSFLSDQSWIATVFLTIIPLFFVAAAVFYTILAFLRFREIEKMAVVLRTRSSASSVRAHRTRRRMYGMAILITIPYFITNIVWISIYVAGMSFGPYSYSANRGPLFNTAIIIPSWSLPTLDVNRPWVWPIQAIPIFWFFGLTKDAVNTYRVAALKFGLGRIWPALKEEYDPDSSGRSRTDVSSKPGTWFGRLTGKLKNSLFDVSENNDGLPPSFRLKSITRVSTFNPFESTITVEDGAQPGPSNRPNFNDRDLEKGTADATSATEPGSYITGGGTGNGNTDEIAVTSAEVPFPCHQQRISCNLPEPPSHPNPRAPMRTTNFRGFPGYLFESFSQLNLFPRNKTANPSEKPKFAFSSDGTTLVASSAGHKSSNRSGSSTNRNGLPPSGASGGALTLTLSGSSPPVATTVDLGAADADVAAIASAARAAEKGKKKMKSQQRRGRDWYDDLTILESSDDETCMTTPPPPPVAVSSANVVASGQRRSGNDHDDDRETRLPPRLRHSGSLIRVTTSIQQTTVNGSHASSVSSTAAEEPRRKGDQGGETHMG